MAVEKIGGTYVIKGAKVKPGVTSTGQSWANLVTQQKYQLWKVANEEAARRIKFEQLNAQRQQQVVDQMRQNLINQQNDTRAQIENLKQLQVEDVARQQSLMAQEQNLRGRAQRRTTSGGGGGGYSGQRYDLTKVSDRLRKAAESAEAQVLAQAKKAGPLVEDDTVLTDWVKGKNVSDNEARLISELGDIGRNIIAGLEDAQSRADTARQEYNAFKDADLPGQRKYIEERLSGGGGGFGGGGSSTYYTSEKPIAPMPVADRQPAIDRLEARLKSLEEQQLGLTDVDIPVGDQVQTARQVLGSKFGIGSQRLPEQPMPQPKPEAVQQQEDLTQEQDFSNVQPAEKEALGIAQKPKPQPKVQAVEQPRITPQEEVVEEPSTSITELASMAYGQQPTAYESAMQRYTQPLGTAERTEPVTDMGLEVSNEMTRAIDRMRDRYEGQEFEFQPSTAMLQSQQDINRNVLQQMRLAEQETLANMVREARPAPTPFSNAKEVMENAVKEYDIRFVQIAGGQVLADYAYLKEANPEEYQKVKDVVLANIAKKLNIKEYQQQKTALNLVKSGQVTPQALTSTVKGATLQDAELIMKLMSEGAFKQTTVQGIKDNYEGARNNIFDYADKGGVTTEQRDVLLDLLENFKAYKLLALER